MTNPSRKDVLRIARECGLHADTEDGGSALFRYTEITRFAAAIGALYAEDMRERAANACLLERVDPEATQSDEDEAYNTALAHAFSAIRAIPITPEGEQG